MSAGAVLSLGAVLEWALVKGRLPEREAAPLSFPEAPGSGQWGGSRGGNVVPH